MPLRFVKWLASKFDVRASEIQIRKKFIPISKYVIHDILDLPVDGEPIVSDAEAGRDFILSHFNVSSIPPVSFFCNKLKSSSEELPDEDIFICFMCIALSTFLCPNSSLSPSPKYLRIFRDCSSVMNFDLSRLVHECLLSSIKKFKDSTKVASKRSFTFGGCHYALAVSYLDHVHFGLNSLPDIKPRILVWRGNKVKHFSELDKNNSRSYGKRLLKRLSSSHYTPKSCERVSCSGAHTGASSYVPFGKKISTSEDIAPAGSNVSFASKVEAAYASRFGNEVVKQIIGRLLMLISLTFSKIGQSRLSLMFLVVLVDFHPSPLLHSTANLRLKRKQMMDFTVFLLVVLQCNSEFDFSGFYSVLLVFYFTP